ncbi:MAG TPA: M67 family metallopeptidase [Candidatus Limnocylindrales bacterium]|nr:M67 family metallopeptidase [Candidatus Limnocylindrales bacterium]
MTDGDRGLSIPHPVMAAIRAHLEAGYPNEACGALVGQVRADRHLVLAFRPMRNTVVDRPHDRYALDPLEQLQVQRAADDQGLEIIGFVHSHPDHPARPSQFDTEHGWPFYSYVVAKVERGTMVEARAFRLNEAQARFDEEPLAISD